MRSFVLEAVEYLSQLTLENFKGLFDPLSKHPTKANVFISCDKVKKFRFLFCVITPWKTNEALLTLTL